MTTASTGDPQNSDDLTAISGIGAVREKVLRESLDVRTFQDLAALSVDEIESQFKAEGQSVSRDLIKQWIAAARELAVATVAEPSNSPSSESEWESAATFVVEFQEREEGEERRTRVHHMEEDVDAEWPDVGSEQLYRWMLEQLGEPVPELPKEVRAEAREELEQELEEMRTEARQELQDELKVERARLQQELEKELEERKAEARQKLAQEMQQLRAEARETRAQEPEEPAEEEAAPAPEPVATAEVEAVSEPVAVEEPPQLVIEGSLVYQPPQAETPRILGRAPSSPDALRRDIPFSLVTSFSVDEAEANELAGKGVTYTAQFHAREISTGEVIQLGTTDPEKYVTGKSTYEARLPDVTLPAGFFQLTIFLSVGTTPPGGIYRQVSILLMA